MNAGTTMLLCLICFSVVAIGTAQPPDTLHSGINFLKNIESWEQVLSKAETVNKSVCVYVFSRKNNLSKSNFIEETLFTNQQVYPQFNERFICIKVEQDSPLGIQFTNFHPSPENQNLMSFPYMLIFDKNGRLTREEPIEVLGLNSLLQIIDP